MQEKLTTSQLKKINRNNIYRLIYKQKECSRQEVSNLLSLSLPTVNQNLKELQEEGLIAYTGSFESTGGRKPQVIIPVMRARCAIGMDIHKAYIRILIIDLAGTVIDCEKYARTFNPDKEYGLYLNYLIQSIVKRNNLKEEEILGVGIALPGVFSENAQKVMKAPSLGVDSFDIKDILASVTYPCLFENDANAGAFTELWNRKESDYQIYISVEKGVGGCILTKEGIYRGTHHRAGEFGHMTVMPGGRKCNCGKYGCLEAYISTERLSEDLGCQVEDFFVRLESGKEAYRKIWEQYLDYLCIGINNIHTMYDSDVILGGMMAQYFEPSMEEIKERLESKNIFEADASYFKLTSYQSRANAVGAALMLVNRFIEQI